MTIATWIIQLNCKCPHCDNHVDLLDYADFWDGRKIAAGEHGTERTENMEVVCPECGADFVVNCVL